jgi:hypothetical protein
MCALCKRFHRGGERSGRLQFGDESLDALLMALRDEHRPVVAVHVLISTGNCFKNRRSCFCADSRY